jgi:hypothetical protein
MSSTNEFVNPSVMQTLMVAGSPTTVSITSSASTLAFDFIGRNLYWTNDGSTWILLAGPSGGTTLTGTGSPVGVQNSTFGGQMYFDFANVNAINVWVSTTTGTAGWKELSGI